MEIILEKIDKSIVYGFCKRKQVIQDLSLAVNKGEVFGFIGPNGAGKSTVINLIMGFTRPDRGTIRIRGQNPVVAETRRCVGYLPEHARYYEHLTPEELLRFGASVSGRKGLGIIQSIDPLLTRVNLLAEKKKPIRTFSKGMKQRMGIALAVVHEPEILVLDEPMSGLDPLGRSLVKDLIIEEKQKGKTVFFSSHILNDVETLCDRVAVIHQGTILFCGSVEQFMSGAGDLESRFVEMVREEEAVSE